MARHAARPAGFASAADFLRRTNILADGRLNSLYAGRPEIACVQFLVQLAAVYQLHVEGLLTMPACPQPLRSLARRIGVCFTRADRRDNRVNERTVCRLAMLLVRILGLVALLYFFNQILNTSNLDPTRSFRHPE